MIQNGQTEPKRMLWVTRRRTPSKQSRLRYSFAICAKLSLITLFFLLPKKHGLLFGAPESRKTLRGRGATERPRQHLFYKCDISDSCDDREAKFVRSKKTYKRRKIERIRFFNIILTFHFFRKLFFTSFSSFCGLDFFYILFISD